MDRYRMLPSYRYYDVEGTPLTLDKSVGKPLRDYKIYGNSFQDGTPTPDNPVEVQSVGDKSKNLLDISSLVHYDNSSNVRTTKTDNNLVVHSSESQTYVYIPSDKSKKGLFDRLKPSTTYRLKYSSRYLEGEPTPSQSRIIFVNSSFVAKLTFYIAKPITVGQIVTINTTFKTPADMSEYDQILIYGAYGNGSRTEIIDWIVTEETETVEPYEPYGYKIPIDVGGKNLFNVNGDINRDRDGNPPPNQFHGNYIVSDNQFRILTSTWATVSFGQFINVGVGKTYTVSLDIIEWGRCPALEVLVHAINPNANLARIRINAGENTMIFSFTATTDTALLAFAQTGIGYGDNGLIIGDVQIEEGDTATEYEPYRKEITYIYLDEPLYKIGNYADYIDKINSKVVRKVNKVSLNGTEYWVIDTTKTLTQVFRLMDIYFEANPKNYCCNRFIASNPGDTEKVSITDCIYIAIDKTRADNVDEFKKWLSVNPTDVFYSLATPIEESIDLSPILTHKGTNVIAVDTDIPPSNMQIQYYK